jgi:hypothetical protein
MGADQDEEGWDEPLFGAANMHHDGFGEIFYQEDDQVWLGRCHLPAFAEYGVPADGALEEPNADLRDGFFPLTIQDPAGGGPSVPQANAFRFVERNEQDVCRAVMSGLLECYRSYYGPVWAWAKERRRSWLLGWLARWLLEGEHTCPEDLKPVVRCTGVELSSLYRGDYAYAAFQFDTADGLDVEHGVSVVFHPEKGASWGDASAIHYIEEADNW